MSNAGRRVLTRADVRGGADAELVPGGPGRRSGVLGQMQYSFMQLAAPSGGDWKASIAEDGSFPFTCSNEQPMLWGWGDPVVLLHRKGNANLERALKVGAVLKNHDPDQIVGPIVSLTLNEGSREMSGRGRFLTTPKGAEARAEYEGGALKGVSIAWWPYESVFVAAGQSFEGIAGPAEVVTKWDLLEVTLTPIPRNPSVGLESAGIHAPGWRGDGAESRGGRADMTLEQLRAALEAARGRNAAAADIADLERQIAALVGAGQAAATAPVAPVVQVPPTAASVPAAPGNPGAQIVDVRPPAGTDTVMTLCEAAAVGDARTMEYVRRVRAGLLTVEEVRTELRAEVAAAGARTSAAAQPIGTGPATAGQSAMEKFMQYATAGVRLRHGGRVENADNDTRRVANMSLVDLQRRCLVETGTVRSHEAALNMTESDLWAQVKESRYQATAHGTVMPNDRYRASMSTSLFPNILVNALNVELQQGYLRPETTWEEVAYTDSLPDFRDKELPRFSEPPRLVTVKEGESLTYAKFSDGKESYALEEYKRGLKFSERMFIQDQFGAFLEMASEMQLWIEQQIDESFWFYFLSNPNLADASPFFGSGRGNYYEGADTALTLAGTALDAQLQNFRLRTGMQGKDKREGKKRLVSLTPGLLIVPPALDRIANTLVSSASDPSQSNPSVSNPFKSKGLRVVVVPNFQHPDLSGASATAWYIATAKELRWARVGFLRGQRGPEVSSEMDFDDDSMKFKFKHRWASKLVKPEGCIKVKGAA